MSQSRTLLVIASYGESHLEFLQRIIRSYRAMRKLSVDVVVVSEAQKHLGNDVEVIVGLPSRNPWSLPFAHQSVFCSRVDAYDLFIYSEDDIGVTEATIDAFLAATPHLAEDEIAGFLRYEVDRQGTVRLDEPWAHFHWHPRSVRTRGPYTVAEFSNEHAGFYIVTRDQLRRAIRSGGLQQGPRTGRYSWPETAATDIYTSCGFRKVHCISHLDDFLVHHMSTKYVDQLDMTLPDFRRQIDVLNEIKKGRHPATTLCPVESSRWPGRWQKSYYEKVRPEILSAVPASAQRILSIGSGWGATETALRERGATITALPLDSVIGGVVEQAGISMIYDELDPALDSLGDQVFDCVLLTNLLHLLEDPARVVTQVAAHVGRGGTLVLSGRNLSRLPLLAKRLFRVGEFSRLRSFAESGFSVVGPAQVIPVLRKSGLNSIQVTWFDHDRLGSRLRSLQPLLRGLTARQWTVAARRPES